MRATRGRLHFFTPFLVPSTAPCDFIQSPILQLGFWAPPCPCHVCCMELLNINRCSVLLRFCPGPTVLYFLRLKLTFHSHLPELLFMGFAHYNKTLAGSLVLFAYPSPLHKRLLFAHVFDHGRPIGLPSSFLHLALATLNLLIRFFMPYHPSIGFVNILFNAVLTFFSSFCWHGNF